MFDRKTVREEKESGMQGMGGEVLGNASGYSGKLAPQQVGVSQKDCQGGKGVRYARNWGRGTGECKRV